VRKEEVLYSVHYDHRGQDRWTDNLMPSLVHNQLFESHHPCMKLCPYPERYWMSTKSLWRSKGMKRMQVELAKDATALMMVFRSLAA
jgi:hypothetical protein